MLWTNQVRTKGLDRLRIPVFSTCFLFQLADMILNEDFEDIFDKASIVRMRMQIGQRLIKETGWFLVGFY